MNCSLPAHSGWLIRYLLLDSFRPGNVADEVPWQKRRRGGTVFFGKDPASPGLAVAHPIQSL